MILVEQLNVLYLERLGFVLNKNRYFSAEHAKQFPEQLYDDDLNDERTDRDPDSYQVAGPQAQRDYLVVQKRKIKHHTLLNAPLLERLIVLGLEYKAHSSLK
jgi:uncharacterized protein HemY